MQLWEVRFTLFGETTFPVTGKQQWNALQSDIRITSELAAIKSNLKHSILNRHTIQCVDCWQFLILIYQFLSYMFIYFIQGTIG